jgi:hypothetical protein
VAVFKDWMYILCLSSSYKFTNLHSPAILTFLFSCIAEEYGQNNYCFLNPHQNAGFQVPLLQVNCEEVAPDSLIQVHGISKHIASIFRVEERDKQEASGSSST